MADMCADCGADLRNEDAPRDSVAVASIPMVHSIPELKVNAEVSIFFTCMLTCMFTSLNLCHKCLSQVQFLQCCFLNFQQAQILGKADEQRLLASKKLVLLVDLDQTLIHTTNDNIPPNLKVISILKCVDYYIHYHSQKM